MIIPEEQGNMSRKLKRKTTRIHTQVAQKEEKKVSKSVSPNTLISSWGRWKKKKNVTVLIREHRVTTISSLWLFVHSFFIVIIY